jgi:hypothetical protein
MQTELKTIEANLSTGLLQVIWEKCFREEICIQIPFDGKKCLSASGCVRILLEGGVYKLEIELFGARKKFDLIEQCVTGFTVGIASLKVCIAKLIVENGRLNGVRLTARLCIGAKIGPINVEKCWDVIATDVKFLHFAEYQKADMAAFGNLDDAFEMAKAGHADFVYVENED